MSIAEKFEVITDAVYEKGKKAEYDSFWDTYQDYGNLTCYDNAFAEGASGNKWKSGITYKPKYQIKPKTAMNMYYATRLPYEDLKEVDFSDCTDFYSFFAYSSTTHLGVIDMTKATRTNAAFTSCTKLHTIDKIISSVKTAYTANTFSGLSSLENVIFEGEIGVNVNFQDSTKLSHNSIASIINALSSSSSGKTFELSRTAVSKAFESTEGANDGVESAEWNVLANTKNNWNIVLV